MRTQASPDCGPVYRRFLLPLPSDPAICVRVSAPGETDVTDLSPSGWRLPAPVYRQLFLAHACPMCVVQP